MSFLLKAIGGFLGGLVGRQGAGAAVADLGVLAALAPVAMWLLGHKDELAVSFTWGQLAIVGLVVAAVIKAAHRAPPPAPIWQRGE
jgi:hypothetical protein